MTDVNKLLDNGFTVTLFRNQLGSYTAQAHHPHKDPPLDHPVWGDDSWLTDDFEPDKALCRLAEKVFKTGMYAEPTR
jgi:hypothetical protein